MSSRFLALSLSLVLASLAADAHSVLAAGEAVWELGQPGFRGFMPNRLDARGLSQPWGVAVDTSRTPNGLWVADAGNNRVLGWRDVTALRNGAPADVILGQPNAISNGCNNGGVSAASLCFIESPRTYLFDQPGLAVDGEGNLYVADRVNRRILGYRRPFDTDRVADVVIGQPGFDRVEPFGTQGVASFDAKGLAADAQGNLYVSDNLRVVELDRPLITDAIADRVFGQARLDTIEYPTDPTAPDRMALPVGVAVDGQGRLYVADGWTDRVMVWKEPLVRQGAADLVFSQGGKVCEFNCINVKGIAVTPGGDVWVGSYLQGKIFGYRSPVRDGDTQPDQVIAATDPFNPSGPKPRPGQPASAHGGLAVDSRGALWLVDVNRVLGFLDPWNGNGIADRLLGQIRPDQTEANLVDLDGLNAPQGLAIDTQARPPHLYVVDTLNNRVLGWADARNFANGQPADLVLGQPDRWASGCNTGGRSLASLCLGETYTGIAVDPKGTVWVADSGNSRVLGYRSPFTTDTVADRELGGVGCTGGRRGMCVPGGVAADKAGNVYVADILNNRILEFDEPLRRDALFDRTVGRGGDAAVQFSEENSTHPGYNIYGGPITVDPGGRLLVGHGGTVYVFEQPLRPGARSRKLIDLFKVDDSAYFQPYGLATDSEGRVYLTSRSEVFRFSRDGSGPSLQLGSDEPCQYGYVSGLPGGLGRDSFCIPTGIAVGLDKIFVSDAGANRVLVFEKPSS